MYIKKVQMFHVEHYAHCQAIPGTVSAQSVGNEISRPLERKPQSELKNPRPTRPEETASDLQGLVELRRRNVVKVSRVVLIVSSANVGDVEKVEDLSLELQARFMRESPDSAHSQIKRIEIVAELQGWIHVRQLDAGIARNLVGAGAYRQGIPHINGSVQLCAVRDFASQSVTPYDRQSSVGSSDGTQLGDQRIHRNARAISEDR